jgi:Protein of unknown function (DUF1553)
MHKLMVMSATYLQNSDVSSENLEKDPRNFLLEHGPRFRLPAEIDAQVIRPTSNTPLQSLALSANENEQLITM